MTTKKLLIAATVLSGLALFAMGASGLAQDNLGKQGQDPQPRKPKAQIPSSVHLFNYGDFAMRGLDRRLSHLYPE